MERTRRLLQLGSIAPLWSTRRERPGPREHPSTRDQTTRGTWPFRLFHVLRPSGRRPRSSPRFRGAFPRSAASRAHPPGLCSSRDARNQVHDVIQTLRLPLSLKAGSALAAAGPIGAAPGTRARGPSEGRRCVLAGGGAASSAASLRSRSHWRAADPGAARPTAAMHRDCSTLLATVDVWHGAYESRSVRGGAP